MIESLDAIPSVAGRYNHFLKTLAERGFRGDIAPDYANRTVLATDNSIYQRLPQAALYPYDGDDIVLIARLASEEPFQDIVLTPRGGGTGTNGQSLTDGLVVDVTRYMNHILDIDVANRRVRVQAGVVKDQLNAALRPYGLFFAPELSTSNRATLGGMINTDASGQGSREYGKTRNHVLELDTVLLDGSRFVSRPVDDDELDALCARDDHVGEVHRVAREIIDTQRDEIEARFPPLNRCLTGYDLAHLRNEDRRFNLNSVLCGAEGSLGFIVEATLNVLPLPKYSALINVRYTGFMDALRDAKALMGDEGESHAPTSIETVDDKVLMLAMEDIVWESVAEYFPAGDASSPATRGINLVEFNADDEEVLKARVEAFTTHLERDTAVERLGHTIAWGRGRIGSVYAMRKRAVGLLGNTKGEKRPIPFVEDTAVPPENLADYIAEFRALLDGYGLEYGMFGHVDAGVLHVRPAIDMKDPEQAKMIRVISDRVAELTHKYHGLLWGEHGKGVRSEYTPTFFGELYPTLQRLKGAFDPRNQLNPGKIATPLEVDGELLKIDAVTTRGELDRQIDERVWQHYDSAVYCNGNGACYNYDPADAMCPSWKGTRDRIHSPKGRASLMREWLRLQGNDGVDVLKSSQQLRQAGVWQTLAALPTRVVNTVNKRRHGDDFSDQVYDAMAGCLACKSCAGQCPIKVNVPDFRSRFLELYHGRYLRPLRDHVVGSLELMAPMLKRIAPLYNTMLEKPYVQRALEKGIGMVDVPTLSRNDFARQLKGWGIPEATPVSLGRLTEAQKARSVVLVQDAFTSFFETAVARDIVELLFTLDINVFVAPYHPNGKPMQVQGFLGRFERTAGRNAALLNTLAEYGIPLVGIDPAMTLTYRQEYVKALGPQRAPEVLLLQEWLVAKGKTLVPSGFEVNDPGFKLLSHCTEKTTAPGSPKAWQQVFAVFGLELELVATGCCGMSGTYGHEARNADTSKTIYDLSWREVVEDDANAGRVLATGYSCRSQAKRFSQTKLLHPLQGLLTVLKQAS
ncbi:D-2-hydroxyglutarate dehydrogenase YdiJ [Phytohalomonas tamaricis]|uniref:D-2-hydroxyglutarate dehydrogenase YdiJ n=1 Tax=Phytohalomonas tamaricis TaxID=2081032 RepID=UPI000D0B5A6F|nr:FAD-binding and (Fe-S)-binding domain-containing protein [Phytohalomonas tamaricis]